MNITAAQLKADLHTFAGHLLTPLINEECKLILKFQPIKTSPLTVRLGLDVTKVSREAVEAAITGPALRDAWTKTWPVDFHGGCDPKSIKPSADSRRMLLDLIFYSAKLSPDDSLS
ncbi:MAG: hypothetical protein KCHDKBKB_02997 [Elusimicrobia bacterium]|nr:hypothetical protein [Elusimicrobiota bacterium]